MTYRCNGDVGLRFARQTPELLAYFSPRATHLFDQPYLDRLARGVAGNPPPGTRWTAFACPGAHWEAVFPTL